MYNNLFQVPEDTEKISLPFKTAENYSFSKFKEEFLKINFY